MKALFLYKNNLYFQVVFVQLKKTVFKQFYAKLHSQKRFLSSMLLSLDLE